MEHTVPPYRERLAVLGDRSGPPLPLHEPRPSGSGRVGDDEITEAVLTPATAASPAVLPTQPHPPLYVSSQPRRERRQMRAPLAALAMVLLLVGLVSVGLGRGFTAAIGLADERAADSVTAQTTDTGADRGAVGAIVEQTKPSPTAPALVPTPPAPASAAAPPTLAMRYRQVAAAEMTLQTGHFVTTVDYGNGTVSTATIRFDLATGGKPPQLALRSEYRASTGTMVTERAINGGTARERRPGAEWRSVPVQQDLRDEIAARLPQLASVPESAVSGTDGVLQWRDTGRGVAMTLTYDPETGVPLTLRQVSEATGLATSTAYWGWNVPVEFAAP